LILTDTHCHLYLNKFEHDLDDVLQRAVEAGVDSIYLPAIDWNSLAEMEKLEHPEITFYKMAGIHPCDVQNNWPIDDERLFSLCNSDTYVAVGETGLDYYWSTDHVEQQKESLRIHCKIAKQVQKPVILHNRESTSDLLDLIESEQDGSLKGIWHCFSGTVDEGKRAIDLGLQLGIGGVLTFRNSGMDRVVKELPIDKMVLETDAPFLAPVPKRGKRNEPSYVIYTARKLAETVNVPVNEVAEITTRNASVLFHSKPERM
jgi:TatD DNase family protein